MKNESHSNRSDHGNLNFVFMTYLYFMLRLTYQLKEMCYSSHTDFFSENFLTSNDPNVEDH